MKKLLVTILLFSLLLSFTALAEGKITVEQKKLVTFEGKWQAFFFAKVANTGDSPCYVQNGCKLVGFNDDDVVFTEDYVNAYPSGMMLKPGEYAYVYHSIFEDTLKTNPVTDYKFSVKGDNHGSEYDRLDCTAEIQYSKSDIYDNNVFVTFTNTTDSTLYDFYIATALYDSNGELIYVDGDSSSELGIHPGSTVTVEVSINSDLVEYFVRNKLTPTTADAMVFVPRDE